MNKRLDEYLRMVEAIVEYVNVNADITKGLPEISATLDSINSTVADIHEKAAEQEAGIKGVTAAKNDARDALNMNTYLVSSKMVAYASDIKDKVLLSEILYTQTEMKRFSDSRIIDVAKVVYDRALVHATALVAYRITEAMIADIQKSMSVFMLDVNNERLAEARRNDLTMLLTKDHNLLVVEMEKLNRIIELVRFSSPIFFEEYTKIRHQKERGKHHIKAILHTVDLETEVIVPNVNLNITSLPPLEAFAIEKRTTENGGAELKDVPEGSYVVVAEKPGYEKATITFTIVYGELHRVTIKMKAIAGVVR